MGETRSSASQLYDVPATSAKCSAHLVGFHIPLFAKPEWFVTEEHSEIIKEFGYMKNYNLPIAKSLEEADSYKLDMFDIINKELNAVRQYQGEKNG